jgi:hypothetical protein
MECLKKCRKSRALERCLEIEIPQEVYDRLTKRSSVPQTKQCTAM